ncbi:hypothetical protein B0186_02765 [Canicola haemoglobinophilus]|uniref:Uncharacterized protein n=1 Tax=Canicola haemoglobinophilus TaxID=733 RepID=A0A1V4B2X2_9PAST|nr:hypothetical protein [Canicola haemoglobinophilus]OOS01636.1 hypothetical protein B0186_02765 [Canicola haemoglobinophilus]STO58905.1 Uncharacterised protein [Canicola haemoglobinophilus]
MALMPKFENGKKIYEGPSGTKYQYDLSNPMDKLAYELDLDAQMRDKLSLNLHRKLENGGGIYE